MSKFNAAVLRHVNRSIDQERSAMQRRHADKVNELRWAEGIAYRDKVFDEGVRRFGEQHALQKGYYGLAKDRFGLEQDRFGLEQDRFDVYKRGAESDLLTEKQLREHRQQEQDHRVENVYPIQEQQKEEYLDEDAVEYRKALPGFQHREWVRRERLDENKTDRFLSKEYQDYLDLETELKSIEAELGTMFGTEKKDFYGTDLGREYLRRERELKQLGAEADVNYKKALTKRALMPPATKAEGGFTGYQQNTMAEKYADEIANDMAVKIQRRSGSKPWWSGGWIGKFDFDAPIERKPVVVGKDPKTGKNIYRPHPDDSLSTALRESGGETFTRLVDKYNGDQRGAFLNMDTVFYKILDTDHGRDLIGKWKKHYPDWTDFEIRQEMKRIFMEGVLDITKGPGVAAGERMERREIEAEDMLDMPFQ